MISQVKGRARGTRRLPNTFIQARTFVPEYDNHSQEISYRNELIDVSKIDGVTPGSIDIGLGEETKEWRRGKAAGSQFSRYVSRYDYVELQLPGMRCVTLMNDDFREAFGEEPPAWES